MLKINFIRTTLVAALLVANPFFVATSVTAEARSAQEFPVAYELVSARAMAFLTSMEKAKTPETAVTIGHQALASRAAKSFNHTEIAAVYTHLSHFQIQMQDFNSAFDSLQKAIANYPAVKHISKNESMQRLAVVAYKAGRQEEAFQWMMDNHLKKLRPHLHNRYFEFAEIYARLRDSERVARLIDAAPSILASDSRYTKDYIAVASIELAQALGDANLVDSLTKKLLRPEERFTLENYLEWYQRQRLENVLKQVPPKYPERMLKLGREAIIVVDFVVNTKGEVEGAEVLLPHPEYRDFEEESIKTVKDFKYRPHVDITGTAVERRLRMDMSFSIAR